MKGLRVSIARVTEMAERPILLDTNILSTFAKIDDVEFLFELTKRDVLFISTSVMHELEDALAVGLDFVTSVMQLIDIGRISILSMDYDESKWSMALPPSFGKGERDTLAVCNSRNGIIFTNERKVANYCKRQSIAFMDLPMILRHSWKNNTRTKDEVKRMIQTIEENDRILFRDPVRILEE